MQSYFSGKTSIVKGDRFSKGQCPHNDIERDRMKAVPYSPIVGSLMYEYAHALIFLLWRVR